MANICDTQYKVTGEPKAVKDLWNTLQKLGVNGNDISLYLLAEHYGIDYEKKGISVRGYIYWADLAVTCQSATEKSNRAVTSSMFTMKATSSLKNVV